MDNPMTDPSVITDLERAKLIADRIRRNKNELISNNVTLDIKRSKLEYLLRLQKDVNDDVNRLTIEVPVFEKRVEQLTAWCAKNLESDEQVELATMLAKRIAKLQKELEHKHKELHRLEAGLPDIL